MRPTSSHHHRYHFSVSAELSIKWNLMMMKFPVLLLLEWESNIIYLNAALSQASGVSTAGKLSVFKSTLSKSSFTDDEVGCIFTRFSMNEITPLGLLLSELKYCSNNWLSVFLPPPLFTRLTIVKLLSSVKKSPSILLC